jgi:hypothetical protein
VLFSVVLYYQLIVYADVLFSVVLYYQLIVYADLWLFYLFALAAH